MRDAVVERMERHASWFAAPQSRSAGSERRSKWSNGWRRPRRRQLKGKPEPQLFTRRPKVQRLRDIQPERVPSTDEELCERMMLKEGRPPWCGSSTAAARN